MGNILSKAEDVEEDNRVVIAAENGIARYNIDLDLWQPVSIKIFPDLGSQIVTSLLIDPNVMESALYGKWYGQVWFGTESGGLYRWLQDAIIWSDPENGSENVAVDIGKIEV